jgi:fatty-acyl-CoA synthase
MHGLTMVDIFRWGASRHAACTVTTVRDGEPLVFTFAQTAERAERLAGALAADGVRPGDAIATLCRNHHEHLEMLFASHLLGTVFVPLNPRADDATLRSTLEQTDPKVLFADAHVADRIDTVERTYTVGGAYEALLDAGAPLTAVSVVDGDTVATVLFTGGTTGAPKGAVHTHRGLYLHTLALSSKLGAPLDPGDTALALVPLNHGLGWQQPQTAWLTGVNLAFIDGSLPGAAVVAGLELTGATISSAVPTVWHDVAGHAEAHGLERLGVLRNVMLGGAMTPPPLPSRLRALGITVSMGWGMTETLPCTIVLVTSPDSSAPQADVRTSAPMPGVEFRVLDDRGEPTDGAGTIEVRAPWITGQYLGRPEPATPWFDTGDVGVVSPAGDLTIVGRAKEMIKSGGEQIWPATIEEALLEHPAVIEAAVIEVPHERWGGQPMACVVTREAVAPEELRAFLLGSLPKWQVPTAWALGQELPRTAVGKVDKRLLTSMVDDASLVPVFVT